MKSVALKAFPRTLSRRGGSKKLRASGRVPATVYGGTTKPQNLEVQLIELQNVLHHSASENVLVDLAVEGDARPKRLALVQEIQHHPLSAKMLHIDLHEVAPDEKVTISVPVEPTGEAIGVKNGGVLEHVLFKLRVRALPKDLPEVIHVDVSGLEIGKAVHIGDIKPAAGVEILGHKELVVLAVAAPVTEAQEEAAAAAAPAGEVEMIKEKKEGEEGAAPAAGAKKDEKAAAGDKGAEKKPAEKKK